MVGSGLTRPRWGALGGAGLRLRFGEKHENTKKGISPQVLEAQGLRRSQFARRKPSASERVIRDNNREAN